MRAKIKVKNFASGKVQSQVERVREKNVLLAKSTKRRLINSGRSKVRIAEIILLACVVLILQQQHQHKAQAARRAPSASSSSLFADVEDLADSSVRTRLGTLTIEHLGSEPADFDRLIERLVQDHDGDSQRPQTFQEISSQVVSSRAPADANNRTTMRFFRNSKTFASIVYTNLEMENNNNKRRIPRKLINCHLVDLEKHSSDVAIYEAKYDIRTLDIDFKQMMQLIEACTNIARLRRRPLNPIGQQPSAPGSQYKSAASSNQQSASSSSSHWPVTVLGRAAPASASAVVQQSHQATTPPPTQVEFVEMHNHKDGINPSQRPSRQHQHNHHHRKSQSEQTNNSRARRRYDPYPPPAFYANYSQPQNLPLRRQLAKTLAQVHEQGKKLVLGEVTAPPTLSNKRAGGSSAGTSTGLRDALQEISSYDTSDLLSIWRGILPGTNWCGMGDRATSYNDLGFESDIDICCRAHDFCPVRLSAFTSGYGLFNWSFYTRSHCWCDQNFLDCLQQAESPLSAVVMKFYFSIMKTTCLNDISSSSESPGKPEVATLARKQQFPPKIGALKQSQWMATKYEQRPAELRHHAGAPEHKTKV